MKAALQILTMKVEGTYGTDAAPTTSANRLLAQNVDINPLSMETDDYAPVSDAFGVYEKIVGSTWCDVSFDVLVASGGTPLGNVSTVPNVDAVLRACGMARAIDPGVSAVYSHVDTGEESVTLWYYMEKVLQKMVGVRGTWSLAYNAGKAPVLSFKGIGLNVPMVDQALPTVSGTIPIRPVAVNQANTTITIGTYTARMSSLVVNQNSDVQYRNLTGQRSVDLVGRQTNGKITFELPVIAEANFLGANGIVTTAQTVTVYITHGVVAGNAFDLSLTGAQLFNPKMKTEKGIHMLECDLHVVRNVLFMGFR